MIASQAQRWLRKHVLKKGYLTGPSLSEVIVGRKADRITEMLGDNTKNFAAAGLRSPGDWRD